MKNDVKSSVQEQYQSVKGSTAAPSGNEDNSVDIRMASKAQNIVNENLTTLDEQLQTAKA